jgi:hypothetical protein
LFDFVNGYRFAWPVVALAPGLEGQVEVKFTGIFQIVPEKELRDLIAADPANGDALASRLTLIGWKDDLTSGGKPVEYSDAARDQLLSLNFMRYAVATAYYTAMNGAVRLKN